MRDELKKTVLKLLFPLLIGFLFFFFVRLMLILVEKAEATCDTGIAPCFKGVEYLLLIPMAWVVSLVILRIYYKKIGYQRAWLILFLGTLLFLIHIFIFSRYYDFAAYKLEILSFIHLPILYLICFGGFSVIFKNDVSKQKRSEIVMIPLILIWFIVYLAIPFLFNKFFIYIDAYRIDQARKTISKIPIMENPDGYFKTIVYEKGKGIIGEGLYDSPFYPFEILGQLNIEWVSDPVKEKCSTEKSFRVDRRWRVFWVEMKRFNCAETIQTSFLGPYRLPQGFDMDLHEKGFIERLR